MSLRRPDNDNVVEPFDIVLRHVLSAAAVAIDSYIAGTPSDERAHAIRDAIARFLSPGAATAIWPEIGRHSRELSRLASAALGADGEGR